MNEFKKLRHRWEMPLVWLSALVTIVVIIGAAAYLGYTIKAHPDVFASEAELPDDVMNAILVILATFFGPLLIYFFRLYAAAGVESNAVLVTEKQYPELYALYKKAPTAWASRDCLDFM